MFEKFFEIFKIGQHTDSSGNSRDWTEAELQQIADNYNANEHEAPIVVGHPKDNDPAFGWIGALKYEGGKLFAKAKSVVPEFVEAVKQGLFKKRSISLYPDLTLRHVGFLGAVPPAVKGLTDLKFKDGEGMSFEFDAFEKTMEVQYQEFVEQLNAANAEIARLKSFEEDNSRLKEQINFATMTAQQAEEKSRQIALQMRKAEFAQYLADKIAYGSVTPAQAEKITMLLEVLDTIDLKADEAGNKVYEFADGNKANPVAIMKEFIELLTKQVPDTPEMKKAGEAAEHTDRSETEIVADEIRKTMKATK